MKSLKPCFLLAPLFLLSLLPACGAAPSGTSNPSGASTSSEISAPGAAEAPKEAVPSDPGAVSLTCRVAAAEGDHLLLAELDGAGVYRLALDGIPVTFEAGGGESIAPGALAEVFYSGDVLESYPAQLGGVTGVYVLSDGKNDLCALYLQALNDLWPVDPALNDDITQLGVDLSQTSLSPSERSAVAIAFGDAHGIFPLEGSFEELSEQGYIDAENLYWPDGCLFSITEQAQDDPDANTLSFTVGKWRGGLAAYWFSDCTSVQDASGHWDGYQIGAELIS